MAPFAVLLFLFLYSGFCLQSLPVVAPLILKDWVIAPGALSTALALTSVGSGLGAMFGGFIGDAKGRKVPIIGFTALQATAMALSSFAHAPGMLDVLMFAVGFGLGGYFSSAMTLMTELAPPRRRGLMISLAILFTPVGLGVCSLTASFLAPLYGWPFIFLAGGAAGVVLLLALITLVPESPNYLARFPGRRIARERILARLALADIEDQLSTDNAPFEKMSAIEVFRARLGLTLVLWLLFFLTYILGSIILGWVPVVLSSAHFPLWMASQSLFYWTLGSVIGTPVSGWVIGRIGVYNTATLFAAAAVAALAVPAFLHLDPSVMSIVIMILPVAGFAVSGVVTSLYTMAADFYPTSMRAAGIGLADGVGRVGGVLGAYLGVFALNLTGASGFFLLTLYLAAASLGIFVLLRVKRRPAMA